MKRLTRELMQEHCTTCGAGPGQNCTTAGRRHLLLVHKPRGPRIRKAPTVHVCQGCGEGFSGNTIGGHRQRCLGTTGPAIWVRGRPTWGPRGHIYLLETMEGPARVKVGFSTNLDRRVADLIGSSPVTLRLRSAWAGSRGHEWDAHRAAREFWVRGEWFRAEAIPTIETILDQQTRRSVT